LSGCGRRVEEKISQRDQVGDPAWILELVAFVTGEKLSR
jgi:hypothetical protein